MLPIDKTYLKTNLNNWKTAILDPAYIIQKETLPTASVQNLGKIFQYIGSDSTDYTIGGFYQCQVVPGSDPVEYAWVEVSTKTLIDNTTIQRNANKELYVPKATNAALGVISAGDGASVDANGELSIIDRLKIANTVPEASEDNYEDIFLYIGTTDTTFTNGSFYKCTRSLNEGVWKYTWTEFGSNEKKILSFTSTSYYTLDKKSNYSMLTSQISTYIRTYHTLPNIILVKSSQANCDIPVGTQIIYYLDPLTASCTDSSNFTCYYTGSGIYCPDENDTTTWRYFLFNDYANLITGATSTTESNATEVSLLTYLKENTLEKVTELPTCTSKLIEERKCYLLTEEQTGYKKGTIYQALPEEIVMPATLEATTESYWNQYVTNGYLVKDGSKWYAAEGYVFSYAPQESGVDNLKVMDYIYYSDGDMASFYFMDGTRIQMAIVFSKGYYQFETIGWKPISGSTLTFNNEDFDVVNDEVSLDASQKIKTFTQAEWDALSSAEKIALAGQNVIISDDEGTQTFEDIIPSNASASNQLVTKSQLNNKMSCYTWGTDKTLRAVFYEVTDRGIMPDVTDTVGKRVIARYGNVLINRITQVNGAKNFYWDNALVLSCPYNDDTTKLTDVLEIFVGTTSWQKLVTESELTNCVKEVGTVQVNGGNSETLAIPDGSFYFYYIEYEGDANINGNGFINRFWGSASTPTIVSQKEASGLSLSLSGSILTISATAGTGYYRLRLFGVQS